MPLGKVFDAREGQLLFSPVSNYYQGKAIRADIGLREKQGEALQQEIDANLPERGMKAEEDRVALQKKQEDRLREVWDTEKDDREKQKFIDTLDVAEATYQNTIASGASEEEANIASYNALLDEADRQNGAGTREEAERSLAEQGFSPEMWSQEGIVKIRSVLGIRPAPLKDTAKMTEGRSMGLQPGTKEWSDWIRGEGEGNKPLAAEVKTQMVVDALNGKFKGEDVDKETATAILDSLGVQRGVDGSVTINLETAQDMANSIIDRTHIGEGSIFTLQNNKDEFVDRLAFSLMRLAKDGRFGGKELEERALVDALGADYDAMLEQTQIADANGNTPTMMGLIENLAESLGE